MEGEEKDLICPEFETVKVEFDSGIALLKLNRPDKLNAFNSQLMFDIRAAFDWVDATDAVKVVIVTGEGRAFCAGADMWPADTPAKREAAQYYSHVTRTHDGVRRDGAGLVTMRILDCHKPVIAAVNGAAVGAGATIQLGMDIRLASTEAKFGFVFAHRGMVPEGCSTWLLSRQVGLQATFDWMYSGRMVSAEEAKEKGMVYAVFEPEDLLPNATQLANTMIEKSAPVAVSVMRRMIWRMASAQSPMEAHIIETRAGSAMRDRPDRVEGVQSFLEKRPPEFPGVYSEDLPAIDYAIWHDWPPPKFR